MFTNYHLPRLLLWWLWWFRASLKVLAVLFLLPQFLCAPSVNTEYREIPPWLTAIDAILTESVITVSHINYSLTGIFTLYCSLNVTGTVYFTRTGCPSCVPGVHFGIALTRRRASLSRCSSADVVTLGFDTDPSHSTINAIMTRPWAPFFSASSG